MKYTTAQDVTLDKEFVPQNYFEFYMPVVEKVKIILAPYESIQIRHSSFSVSPKVKLTATLPSVLEVKLRRRDGTYPVGKSSCKESKKN